MKQKLLDILCIEILYLSIQIQYILYNIHILIYIMKKFNKNLYIYICGARGDELFPHVVHQHPRYLGING